MANFNLREYLFKDRPGEEAGKRVETVITLGVWLLITLSWILIYSNPIVIGLAVTSCLVAGFSLIQTIRGKASYLLVLVSVAMATVIAISILEGEGVHDLIWMASLGLFLTANIASARNNDIGLVILSGIILVSFFAAGVLEINGILPNHFGTNFEYVVVNNLILLGVMGAITGVFHNHRLLLRVATESRLEQIGFNERLEQINRTLESQVRSRTEALNKLNEQLLIKTAKLQAAAEISQDLLENTEEPTHDLLGRTSRLISEKLGYYHVGIFIVDAARGFAVLQAANSKGGQQMLSRQHQLKVGGTGIVGYVAQSGRPRIALDTGADAVFFNNPYLPETRSEISLPIKYLNTVIGVLDVQSTQSGAFNDEDTTTLMTIANQLALILQKSGDGSSGVAALKGFKRTSRFSNWDKQAGYSFRPDGSVVTNVEVEITSAVKKAIDSGETVAINKSPRGSVALLAVPVKFRDQVIGIIQIESAENNRGWTEDEILLVQAISDRAALALENARLFENATLRAEQEETISRVTTQIGSSIDFERIMRTTIQELGLALGASKSFIQIGSPTTSNQQQAAE